MPTLSVKHFERGYVYTDKENIVISESLFHNLKVLGQPITHYDNKNTSVADSGMQNTDSYFTTNVLSVPANKKVGHIVIGISDLVKIGTITDGINVGVVKKRDNTVMSRLIVNSTATVQKNIFPDLISCNNIIVIPINMTWAEEVYFMIGAKGAIWGEKANGDNTPAANGSIGTITVGQSITLNPNGGLLGKAIILGEPQSTSTAFCAVNKSNDGINLGTLQGQHSTLFNYMTQEEVTAIKNLFN